MKKNMSWKFTDESSITFQSSISGVGEFGLGVGKEGDCLAKNVYFHECAKYLVMSASLVVPDKIPNFLPVYMIWP